MANSYGPQSIVQDGLVFAADAGNTMCYTSGSATATDIVGNTTLTLNNGSGVAITPFPNSWRFDGSDDYISSTTGPTLPSTSTFSCWFNPDSYINYKGIVSSPNYYQVGYNNNWSIQVMADYSIRFIFCNGTSYDLTTPNPGNLTGTWNYLVVTTEPDSPYPLATPHINNITYPTLALSQGQTNLLADVSNGIYFGNEQGYHFDGFIGCMLLYNKTLSAAEMLQNYNATKNRFQ